MYTKDLERRSHGHCFPPKSIPANDIDDLLTYHIERGGHDSYFPPKSIHANDVNDLVTYYIKNFYRIVVCIIFL